MKWLVRLYPRAWRDRYAAELTDLVDELHTGPGVAVDLVRGALVERLRSLRPLRASTLHFAGGPSMTNHSWQRHPDAMAMVALAIVLPSTLFIAVSLLAYQFEVPGMVAVVDPITRAMNGSRIGELVILGAPFLAFVLAVVPLIGGGLSGADGDAQFTLRVWLRPLNVAIGALAVLVTGVLVAYVVTEFLLEAAH